MDSIEIEGLGSFVYDEGIHSAAASTRADMTG